MPRWSEAVGGSPASDAGNQECHAADAEDQNKRYPGG